MTRSSAPAAAITLAPRYFATWMPALPSPPAAPITSTHSPACSLARSRSSVNAVGVWRDTTVAVAKSRPSGHDRGAVAPARRRIRHSRPRRGRRGLRIVVGAAVGPVRNCTVTRSPTLRSVTPGPSLATTPDGSTPGTSAATSRGARICRRAPRVEGAIDRDGVDLDQHLARAGLRRRNLLELITLGGPNSRITMAFNANLPSISRAIRPHRAAAVKRPRATSVQRPRAGGWRP